MIRFFKSPQPAALIVIPFIIISLWAYHGWNCVPMVDASSLPVWKLLASIFNSLPTWLNFILLVSLISAEGIYFNLIINKHEVLYKNSYLPSLIFALIISSTPGLFHLHPVHFVNLIILVMFDRTFTMFKNDKVQSALFDASFLTGIAALLYFPALLLFPLIILALSILRSFNLKEWLIVIIGFILPFFFVSVYMFWIRNLIPFWSSYLSLFPKTQPALDIVKTPQLLWLAIVLGSLLIYSLLKLRSNFSKNVIRTRNFQQIFFVFLLLGAISIGITKHIQVIHFGIIAIPVALFISYLYLAAKKRLRLYELSLWILIGLIIWNQFA